MGDPEAAQPDAESEGTQPPQEQQQQQQQQQQQEEEQEQEQQRDEVANTGLLWRLGLRGRAPPPWKGRCILITGCDSGIGQALVEETVAAGFVVVAACYSEEGARQYREQEAASVVAVVGDLATSEGRRAVADAAKEKAGGAGLYALVNNAAVALPGTWSCLPPSRQAAAAAPATG